MVALLVCRNDILFTCLKSSCLWSWSEKYFWWRHIGWKYVARKRYLPEKQNWLWNFLYSRLRFYDLKIKVFKDVFYIWSWLCHLTLNWTSKTKSALIINWSNMKSFDHINTACYIMFEGFGSAHDNGRQKLLIYFKCNEMFISRYGPVPCRRYICFIDS